MSLFANLSAIAPSRARPKVVYQAKPLAKFLAAAEAEVDALKAGDMEGKWFRFDDKGQLVLTFRNGIKVMHLPDNDIDFTPSDRDAAVALIETVKQIAIAGGCNDIFAAQAKKRA